MGVARDATEAQIKQAYRKLARKYHPDVSKEKDAEARFKEVGEAYEVLKSPEKRAAYDQLGQGPAPARIFRPPPDWGAGFEFSGAGGGDSAYSDFFESLFGAQGRAGRRASRGAFHRRARRRSSRESAARSRRHIAGRNAPAHSCASRRSTRGQIGLEGTRTQRPGAQGHPGRPEVSASRPGCALPHGEGQPRGSVHRSRFSAAFPVPGRRARFVSRSAGRPLGGGAGRHRENADAHRNGGPENSRRLARRQQAAAEGPRHSRRLRPAISTSSCRLHCRRPTTTRPRPLTRPWPRRCPSILARISECKPSCPRPNEPALSRRHIRGIRGSHPRGLEPHVRRR